VINDSRTELQVYPIKLQYLNERTEAITRYFEYTQSHLGNTQRAEIDCLY